MGGETQALVLGADGIDPRPRRVEMLLGRLGVRDDVARLLASTPSLRLFWLGSVAAILGLAVLASSQATDGPRS